MLELMIKVIVVSVSGALAPGPLTAAAAAAGLKRGWRAGLEASVGHTIVELPLVILLSAGVMSLIRHPQAVFWLGLFGSLFLLYFGVTTIREAFSQRKTASVRLKTPSPLLTGIGLTALNPYFLAWWVGIGSSLIPLAVNTAGWFGVGILYVAHVWQDYGWLTLVAALSSLGRLKTRIQRIIMIGLGGLVIYFGISMLVRIL